MELGGKKKDRNFQRNILTTLNEINSFRKEFNNTDIYSTIYQYNSTDQNESLLYAPLYFDLDYNDLVNEDTEETAFEIIREDAKKVIAILDALFYIPEEQLKIYFSGAKGVHILVPQPILGIQPRKDLNEVFRTLVTDIKKYIPNGTVDTKIYDNKRLFRLPNSINGKTGLYKIPLLASELRTLSFNDVKLLAKEPRKVEIAKPVYNTRANRMFSRYIDEWLEKLREIEDRKNKTYKTSFKYVPPCIQTILEEGVGEGSRNHTVAAISSFFKQQGLSENEVLDRLTKFNAEMVQPPLAAKEVETTVSSIFSGEYRYGCRTLIELGFCKTECKIAQKKGN